MKKTINKWIYMYMSWHSYITIYTYSYTYSHTIIHALNRKNSKGNFLGEKFYKNIILNVTVNYFCMPKIWVLFIFFFLLYLYFIIFYNHLLYFKVIKHFHWFILKINLYQKSKLCHILNAILILSHVISSMILWDTHYFPYFTHEKIYW